MSRYTRNRVLQAQIESTYGTNPGSWAGANVVLLSDVQHRIDRDVIPRNLIRTYMGGSEHLVGTRRSEITFEVELAGSGTAGTAPWWGRLLRACGMAETVVAGTYVAYTPVSTGFESVTFRYFIDGVKYVSRGARGSVEFDLTAIQRPVMRFRFLGFDTLADDLDNNPSGDYSAWQRPLVVTDGNSSTIRMGASLNAGTGVISSGTALPSRGLMVDLGNRVSHIKLLGGEAVDIVDRDANGSMTVALTAAEEETWRNDINANTLTSLGFQHGTTTGNIVGIFMPSMQRINPQMEDYEGRALMSTELRVLPSTSGNDEISVIAR